MNPVASVIMPCSNAASHPSESVGNVLTPPREDRELVIVDDGAWKRDLSAARKIFRTAMQQAYGAL